MARTREQYGTPYTVREAELYLEAHGHNLDVYPKELMEFLIAREKRLVDALRVAASAELYNPATGIIDADVLEIVQDTARAALAEWEEGS